MADTSAINSPDYWNRRFAVDWTERGGAEQTAFFARLAVEMLPDWFWRDAKKNALSLLDVGCALGEALPGLKARMPASALAGADVSEVAIGMAKARLPEFAFHVVAADWSDAPPADIVFCSNTLEHMEDWRDRLAKLAELAKRYVVVLVPFQERDLIEEHVASFDFTSFPAELADGKRLIFFRIVDAAAAPETHWPGHQALAVYGPRGKVRKQAPADLDAYAGVDLRGLTPQRINAAMKSLRAAPSASKRVAALEPERASDLTQGIIDRINGEWERKFAVSNAEHAAKHAEMKAYYDAALNERNAKIAAFDQLRAERGELERAKAEMFDRLMAARVELEQAKAEIFDRLMATRVELERAKTVVEYQAAELRREREQNDQLRMSLLRLPLLEEESAQLGATKKALAERNAVIEALEVMAKSLQADVAAAKAAIHVAIEERDEARRIAVQPQATPGAPAASAEIEALVTEFKGGRAGIEMLLQASERNRAEIASLQEEKARHEQNALRVRDHYEAHLREINARLANFAGEMQAALETLHAAWRGDLSRRAGRATLEQHYARELRTLLSQLLSSKTWSLAMQMRRAYWRVRGDANPGMPVIPEPPAPGADDAVSDFLAHWDVAKGVLGQISLDPNPAGATGAPQPVQNAPANIETAAPTGPRIGGGSNGPTIAMQVASLTRGGLERVVLDLCIGLQLRGVRVIVIAVSGGGPIADELRQRGVSVFEIDQDKAEYERLLRDENVSDLFMHHSYFGVEQAAKAGVRLYDVVHNYYFWHRDKAAFIHEVTGHCERVIYVSSAVRQFHERVFGVPSEKGIVINNPAHLDGLIVPDSAQLLRLREKSQEAIFLNVAQAFPAKAQPAMITSFARAYRARGGMRLQIAGAQVREDAGRALKQRIVEERVDGVVELLGHCDRRAMSRVYAQAHAFVLPSIYEGYSVSAIEAAAYHLPLIMTAVGGAQDLIANGGCGILLPPAIADLSQLSADAIERIGLSPENGATAALEQAFLDVATHRAQWIRGGLDARFNVRSLDEVIEAYLAVAGAAIIARR